MKKFLIASLLMVLPTFVSAAGDAAAGKGKSAVCAACHGAEGISAAPIYPNLKGQKEMYLVGALKAYKSGERKGGMSAIMIPTAVPLSDIDIADLAAYYASLK